MTDQEKLELLLKALKENGWSIDNGFYYDEDHEDNTERYEYYSCSKSDVYIVLNLEDNIMKFSFSVKNLRIRGPVSMEYVEVYSDHIEFLDEGVAVMVRFSDAYVLHGVSALISLYS